MAIMSAVADLIENQFFGLHKVAEIFEKLVNKKGSTPSNHLLIFY